MFLTRDRVSKQKGKSSKTTNEERILQTKKPWHNIDKRVERLEAKLHMVEGESTMKEGKID